MPDHTAFCRAFIAEAKRLLAENPQVPHAWTIAPGESSCTLVIPKTDENGFDITFAAELEEFDLTCGGFWASDAREEGSTEDFAGHCVGLLYDLLTPLMRVREQRADGKPYKWTLECRRGDTWESRGSHSRLLFKYWGKRSERIFQNETLPLRQDPLKS
jgi:hypothetical protein